MSEIRTPGVTIEGVATATAAFLGRTASGPATPTLVTSAAEYALHFGGAVDGYMPEAVAGFFENGGRRAVIVRVAPGGGAPIAADYAAGLATLDADDAREVALVHAPDAQAVPGLIPLIIAHCEGSARFAVIDAPKAAAPPLEPRAAWDTSHAAFYYPWIQAAGRLVPPGGAVLGVYARTDLERGVWKAPANAVVHGATGLEREVTQAEQDVLNPAGVNVIRAFPDRGIRVWGARTLSSDGEWKYVNVRRLFNYLVRSIDEGTRWVVFEPNDEALWARVGDTIRLFLRAQWRAGALMGRTEREAFFVTCDRTTMTQDDIDSGRLICEVGVAPARPAEFVIFRIGQWTADRNPP